LLAASAGDVAASCGFEGSDGSWPWHLHRDRPWTAEASYHHPDRDPYREACSAGRVACPSWQVGPCEGRQDPRLQAFASAGPCAGH
jgi:hypothetical protein